MIKMKLFRIFPSTPPRVLLHFHLAFQAAAYFIIFHNVGIARIERNHVRRRNEREEKRMKNAKQELQIFSSHPYALAVTTMAATGSATISSLIFVISIFVFRIDE